MKAKALTLAAGLALACCARSRAIELSLEENRAQRGSIGYVDMQKLFKAYPETIRAKEIFEDVVRQAEEQVNLRKAAVLRLRNELSELKIQRDFMAQNPVVSEIRASTSAAAPSPTVPVSLRGGQAAITFLPGVSTAPVSTAAASLSTGPAVSAAAISTNAAVAVASATLSAGLAHGTTAQAGAPAPAVSTAAIPAAGLPPETVNLVRSELDAKIAQLAKELAQKEADFKESAAGCICSTRWPLNDPYGG